jgi:23S rRNA pseudouridine1911/1915/1917 synthase
MEPVLARLRTAYPESSGRTLRQWLREGRVRVNGQVARDPREPVAPGSTVSVAAPEPRWPAPLGLVHEDDALLVIVKPPGLLTIATERERQRTAYRLVWDYLAARRPPGRPFVVHRLDRETSGLLVLAKSHDAKRRLQAQFEARAVERRYHAVVEGVVTAAAGRLDTRLRETRDLRVRPAARGAGAGRRAVTDYRVLHRGRDATLLELALGTGRRHQIRVQLAALGHPVLGDAAHGSRRDPLGRLCLHAVALGFFHPITRRAVRFESAAPDAFARLVTARGAVDGPGAPGRGRPSRPVR